MESRRILGDAENPLATYLLCKRTVHIFFGFSFVVFDDTGSLIQNVCQQNSCTAAIRAGPQNEKWSNRQNTWDPTGSMHKKAGEKKFDPKKVDFD